MKLKLALPLLLAVSMLGQLLLSSAEAQTDPAGLIGNPPGSTQLPVRFGFANLDNGNLHLEIPLYSNPERGEPAVSNTLIYDSTFWGEAPGLGYYPTTTSWILPSYFGGAVSPSHAGSIGKTATTAQACYTPYTGAGQQSYTNWTFTELNGTGHTFYINPQIYSYNCLNSENQPPPSPPSATSSGGAYDDQHTGMYLSIAAYSPSDGEDNPAARATVYWPDGSTGQQGETPNGNEYVSFNATTSQYLDELGANLQPATSSCVNFYHSYPYTPQASVACTQSVSAWNGATNRASIAVYTYTWEYIPVCTQFSIQPAQYPDTIDFCGGMLSLPPENVSPSELL